MRRTFKGFSTEIRCVGHTHIPYIVGQDGTRGMYQAKRRQLINVGSAGQPRDGDPGASFCMIATTLHAATADAITRARLPDYLGKPLHLGR